MEILMTLTELQKERRWVLHKQKVPHQPNGKKALPNKPSTWHTYAECMAVVSQFDGVGIALGNGVWGVDIDKCADADTGKFSPESRAVVIELDSYGEYSPSGTGCHVLGLGKLPGPGIKKPFGAGAIEIKSDGFYFTYTARHLSKTPAELMDRQKQIEALYKRFSNGGGTLTVLLPLDEEARFTKLWAGDCSDYDGDHSRADFALCKILMRRFNNNFYKADDEFRKSGLYRDKWEREDYRTGIFLKLLAGQTTPVLEMEPEPIDDDSPTEYLVEALGEPGYEGWFPKGEVSLIGGSSGTGKTSLMIPMLENIRLGRDVFGHTAKPREYGILLHDRSKKAMRRTARALNLSADVMSRVIRLSPEQQRSSPADILKGAIATSPGAEAWLIEGLDMWIPKISDMDAVSQVMDGLQRVAILHDVAVIATVGSPKQKKGEGYALHRDSLLGSSALGRKAETVMLMELHSPEDPNSVRRCTILSRCGKSERLYFEWQVGGMVLTAEPEAVQEVKAIDRMEQRIFLAVKPGDELAYQPAFGNRNLFFEWKKRAHAQGKVCRVSGKWYRAIPEKEAVN
jgi:hypothetical protein